MILFVFALLIAFGGGYFLINALPSPPKASEVYVLAVPALNNAGNVQQYPPYAGVFPIRRGDTRPVKTLLPGEVQYPFLCGRDNSRDWVKNNHVQPLVDNQDGIGIPIFSVQNGEWDSTSIVGYSKDCLFPTPVRYYYKRVDDAGFYPLEEADEDIEQITINGRSIDFIVRIETGTINRFFMLLLPCEVKMNLRINPQAPTGTRNWCTR